MELYEFYTYIAFFSGSATIYGEIKIYIYIAEDSVKWTTGNAEETDSESDSCSDSEWLVLVRVTFCLTWRLDCHY